MISMEGGEEARITPMVLSSQQGLQWSPGKCSFFPVERLWITHRAPLRLGLLLRAWQFLEAFAARCFCLSVPLLGFLTELLRAFHVTSSREKQTPKSHPKSSVQAVPVSIKWVEICPQSQIIACHGNDPHHSLFILYKVIFSVCCSIQTLKKSKSLLFNSEGEAIFQRRECTIREMWKLASHEQRHFPAASLSADSCLLQPKPDKI